MDGSTGLQEEGSLRIVAGREMHYGSAVHMASRNVAANHLLSNGYLTQDWRYREGDLGNPFFCCGVWSLGNM